MKRCAPYAVLLVLYSSLFITVACSTTQSSETNDGSPPVSATKSGSQLWGENCARCHNMRSPASYSDAEWSVVAQHMRLRANLTGDDARAIETFLKAGN